MQIGPACCFSQRAQLWWPCLQFLMLSLLSFFSALQDLTTKIPKPPTQKSAENNASCVTVGIQQP